MQNVLLLSIPTAFVFYLLVDAPASNFGRIWIRRLQRNQYPKPAVKSE